MGVLGFSRRLAFCRLGRHGHDDLSGEPDRVCDTVAEFAHIEEPNRRLLVDAEVQSAPSNEMLERLGEYMLRLRREHRHDGPGLGKFEVSCVLLSLTGNPQTRELNNVVPQLNHAAIQVRPCPLALQTEDAALTLAAINHSELSRWVLPWIPLMSGGDDPRIIEAWKAAAQAEPHSRTRRDLAALACIFADLAQCRALWLNELKEFNVEQSKLANEWREEGREVGREEGREEGRDEAYRENVKAVLRKRLGEEIPRDIQEFVDQSKEPQLAHLFDVALSAESFEEIRDAMQHSAAM